MFWLFAVQGGFGGLAAVLIGSAAGYQAFWSALAAVVLGVFPNLILAGVLRSVPAPLGAVVLLAGKPLGLLASVAGLVSLSRVWPAFDWFWALVGLGLVAVAWLAAPAVMVWAERRQDGKKIDEIVAQSERSVDKSKQQGAG